MWERVYLIISKNLLIVYLLILYLNFEICDDEEFCKVIYFRDLLKKSIYEMNFVFICYEKFCIKLCVKYVGGGYVII